MQRAGSFQRFQDHQGQSALPNIRFAVHGKRKYHCSYWQAIGKSKIFSPRFSGSFLHPTDFEPDNAVSVGCVLLGVRHLHNCRPFLVQHRLSAKERSRLNKRFVAPNLARGVVAPQSQRQSGMLLRRATGQIGRNKCPVN
jgi:hypothetical protein